MYFTPVILTSVCVCVLGMDGIKSQGGNLRSGTGDDFGKAFVGVTQHTVPHASDIDVYPPPHSQASTTPHTPPAYVIIFTHEYTQVLTTGLFVRAPKLWT